jgi:hypothetical protein
MLAAAGRCRFPWSHQDYLRLDDSTVECVFCHRTRREPRHVKENHVSKFLSVAARVSKEIAAALAAGGAAYSTAIVSGTVEGGEYLTIAAAIIGAFVVTYIVPANKSD